mgnify:CR=1 FL=1
MYGIPQYPATMEFRPPEGLDKVIPNPGACRRACTYVGRLPAWAAGGVLHAYVPPPFQPLMTRPTRVSRAAATHLLHLNVLSFFATPNAHPNPDPLAPCLICLCCLPASLPLMHTPGMPRANKAISRERPDGDPRAPADRTVLQQHVMFWDR